MTTFDCMSNLVTTTTCELNLALVGCLFWGTARTKKKWENAPVHSRPTSRQSVVCPQQRKMLSGYILDLRRFLFRSCFLARWSFQPGLSLVFVLPHKVYSNCRAHVSTLPGLHRFLRRQPEASLTQSALVPPYPRSGTSASSQSLFLFFFLLSFFFFLHIPVSSSRERNISTLEPLAKCCWPSISFLLAWNQNDRL